LSDTDIRFSKGGLLSNDEKKETYKKWKELVNMSVSELKKFMDSDEGKEAGLTKEQANKLGIHYGRESAKWILRMKETPVEDWTPKMWEWAKRQISFNSRMRGNKGKLYDEKGIKTRKHLSLLIWGHNPEKYNSGGEIDDIENQAKQKIDWVNYLFDLIENQKNYAIETLYFDKATGNEIYQYISFLNNDGNYKKPSVISKLNNSTIGTLSQVEDIYKNYSLDKLGFKIIKIGEQQIMEQGGKIEKMYKYFRVTKNNKPLFVVRIQEGDENIDGMINTIDNLTDYGYYLVETTKDDYDNFDFSNVNADDINDYMGILQYFTDGGLPKFNTRKIPNRQIFNLALEVRNNYPELWFKRGYELGNQSFKEIQKVMQRGYWLDSEQELFEKRHDYISKHKKDYQLDDIVSMLKWAGEVDLGYDYMINIIRKNK
jgi:hypothetical protein